MDTLVQISSKLRDAVSELTFNEPITNIYNPLDYAWDPHVQYLNKFGNSPKKVLLLGMNPGPFGMTQTGIPFGDISMVRDWMGITGKVNKPDNEHPKRLVEGFSCKRHEGSGKRLWGWAKDEFVSADNFFELYFVINYCPLIFFDNNGSNITPDKLPKLTQLNLNKLCDEAVAETIQLLNPLYLIGIGNYAYNRLKAININENIIVDSIIHPSPANPQANRGWAEQINSKFIELGIINKKS
jgi:single-strand selective monofunctional uracil DNA glycosylase